MISQHAAIPSDEAAARLGVEPSRIRAMIRDGVLSAEKIGGRWFIDAGSVDRRRSIPASEGRPFESKNAWALIHLWHGGNADWLNRWERSRLKRHLKLRDLRELVPALRARADHRSLRAHPAALGRVLDSEAFHAGGISAAECYGADIAASGEIEGYVSSSYAPALIRDFHLEASSNPNVLLHVVDGPWLSAVASGPHRAVPALCVALDLIESVDQRSRRAGHELLDRLIAHQGAGSEDSAGRSR